MDNTTILELTNPETYALLADDITFAITRSDSVAAYEFVVRFEPLLRAAKIDEKDPELYQKYQQLFYKSRWLALQLLPGKEVVELFEKHLLVGLTLREDPPFDLWDTLHAKLRNILIINERMVLKRQVKDALLRNQEHITKTSVSLDGKQEPGTLTNWFRDYHREVGMGDLDLIKQSSYFSQGKNFASLSVQEKEWLKQIFHVYEKIKLSSLTPAGFEDPIGIDDEGKEGTIRDGVFEPLDPAVAKKLKGYMGGVVVDTPNAPMQRPTVPSLRQQHFEDKSVALPPQKDAPKFFLDLLSPPQGTKVVSAQDLVAGVSMAAEQNALEKMLIDPKIRELFTAYLKTKNAPDLLGGFRLAPTMPRFMGLFLQWVLQEKGKMSENDAARVGAQLANTLKKKYGNEKYMRIAYYDAGTGQFKWS